MTQDRGHDERGPDDHERGCAYVNEHEDERRALLLLRRRSQRANGVTVAQARKKELKKAIQICSLLKWYPRLDNTAIRQQFLASCKFQGNRWWLLAITAR